jgi:hypothetical protein
VKTRTATLAAALAAILLAAVASGCGSSSANDGVASLDDTADTTTGSDSSDSDEGNDQDPEEKALAWAKCMREHGVDVPDPQVESGDNGPRLTIRPGSGSRLDSPDSEAFQEAQKACGLPFGRSGRPPLSDERREQMQEAMLAFAKCMREHGVDMPDPQFSGGGGLFRATQRGGSGVDPDSPTFQKAQKACQPIIEDALPGRADGNAGTDERSDG